MTSDTCDFTRTGAWITAVYKAFAPYDQGSAAFDSYEATILAAKAGVLLSSIRSLGSVPAQQLDAYRRLARIKPRELPTILKDLEALGVITVRWLSRGGDRKTHSVEAIATSSSSVYAATGRLFRSLQPTDQEKATIAVLELTLPVPIPRSEVASRIAALGHGDLAVDGALKHLASIKLLGMTSETEAGEPILYNPYVYASPSLDVHAILKALERLPQEKALGIIEHIKTQPGVPLPNDTDPDVLALMITMGVVDSSAILARGGAHKKEFPTLPHLWGAFGPTSEASLSVDLIDDAKLFLNSLRYGQFYSSSSRGKIADPWVLLDRLITRGEVGPATAIGEDYPLPLARGIVSIVESRLYVGRFHMQLRKHDIAEAVRDILEHNAILPQQHSFTAAHFGTTGAYFAPEVVRIDKPLPTELQHAADALAFELRTHRKR